MGFPIQNVLWSQLCPQFQGIKCIATLQYNQGSIESNLESLSLTFTDTTTAAGLETISIIELAITTFLNSLPARFGNVRSFLKQQPNALSLNSVRLALLNVEERHKTRDLKAGFAAAATKVTKPRQNKRCPCGFPRDRCWICDPSKPLRFKLARTATKVVATPMAPIGAHKTEVKRLRPS